MALSENSVRGKELRGVANNLCQLLVAWSRTQDLGKIAELPDGDLEFDIISGIANHSVVGPVELEVCRVLKEWLGGRLDSLGVPRELITEASLHASFNTGHIATNRDKIISYVWECRSRLSTRDKEYLGDPARLHLWHTRSKG